MSSAISPGPAKPAADIVFKCQHCSSSLVVDAAAAGMTLNCQRCEKPTQVPIAVSSPYTPAADDSRASEVQRLLKENDSQRTEITGYINQLSIQLHRWQLRLQTLNDRKHQLEAELRSNAA